MSFKPQWKYLLVGAAMALPGTVALNQAPVQASDHGDTAENIKRIGADLTDLYVFPSPRNSNNVVLAMNVRPLIRPQDVRFVSFDPTVLYQFKIDNTGDNVEDLVIQARFQGSGPNQLVRFTGPVRPNRTGTQSVFQGANQNTNAGLSSVNRVFSPTAGTQVFAGTREDPFFFDLERFYQILPDRVTPLRAPRRDEDIDIPNPNAPRANGWRPPGQARDFFRNINVLSFIVELPRQSLRPSDSQGGATGNGQINVWMTTSVADTTSVNANTVYTQQDRLARPAVNEVLATVSGDRHKINNRNTPNDDPNELARDIRNFFRFPAGRSEAIANVAASVLAPDVMKVDLSQSGPAAYLGVETGGFTGGRFGGRKLSDDVVDIDLGAIFGNVIPALGLAPDDGRALPQFTSDNVSFQGNQLNVFPYLAPPA